MTRKDQQQLFNPAPSRPSATRNKRLVIAAVWAALMAAHAMSLTGVAASSPAEAGPDKPASGPTLPITASGHDSATDHLSRHGKH